jgi:tetratricopeptide (TPR) repeat protein
MDRQGKQAVLAQAVLALLVCSCQVPGAQRPEVPSEQIQALLQRKQEAQSLFDKAVALEAQPEEQKKLYLEALRLDPSLGKAYNNLGVICLDAGGYEEAVLWLREAVKRMPGDAAARFNLGYAYELIGRLWTAEEQYRAAAKLSPDEPDYLESFARVCIRLREDLGDARKLLGRALSLETRPDRVAWIQSQIELIDSGVLP